MISHGVTQFNITIIQQSTHDSKSRPTSSAAFGQKNRSRNKLLTKRLHRNLRDDMHRHAHESPAQDQRKSEHHDIIDTSYRIRSNHLRPAVVFITIYECFSALGNIIPTSC